MDSRPPEVTDTASGENLKLACMACIRGHRTKHCGGNNCRDKVLWTIKRPGRPSNSCMCKFSGTGRCKCVLAKTQCPHKPKKGEKKTVDCRCDERGRLCCTLGAPEWEMIGRGERPGVRMYRNLEELRAGFTNRNSFPVNVGFDGMPQGQSPMSAPRTPAASVGGFTNGSGGSTPQTPMSVMRQPVGVSQAPSVPQSPAGPAGTRFGMMGIGAPMGSEGHVGQDVLSWQGHTPIAPAPRPSYATPPSYPPQPAPMSQPFTPSSHNAFAAPPYTFDNAISQPPAFSPQHQPAYPPSQPHTPLYQPQGTHQVSQPTFDTLPPVTESFNELSMAPNGTMPALSGFDMDYFNFQFPGAICQQCGMADCTCRSCPTVLQNTMDGSWRQCCSRKHVHFGAPTAAAHIGQAAPKSCCGSKSSPDKGAHANNMPQSGPLSNAMAAAPAAVTREPGGCCGGSGSRDDFTMDDFDFNVRLQDRNQLNLNGMSPELSQFTSPMPTSDSNGFLYDPAAPLPHTHPPSHSALFSTNADPNPELDFKQDPLPGWMEPSDIDMNFDDFIQQDMGCGCGTECPCGMDDGLGLDDSLEMDLDGDPGGGVANREGDGESAAVPKKGCCGS